MAWGVLTAVGCTATGQTPIAVGAGSYADLPPRDEQVDAFLARPMYFVDRGERAVPTNDWWTDLVFSPFGSSLWAQPIKVDARPEGVEITLPTRWADNGQDLVSEHPLRVGGAGFEAKDARVLDWGDWTVTFRLAESADRYIDVTIGRGMPTVWLAYHGVEPTVRWQGQARVQRPGGGDVEERPLRDGLMIESQGRSWGVFPTASARARRDGDGLALTLDRAAGDGPTGLMIAAMNRPSDYRLFGRASRWWPAGSRLDWSWDREAGVVRTMWALDLRPWSSVGSAPDEAPFAVQGWLPHHLAQTQASFDIDGPSYLSPRGSLRTAAGAIFEIDFPFRGVMAAMPSPAAIDPGAAFDRAAFGRFLDRAIDKPKTAPDSYWSGKDTLRHARYAMAAAALGDERYERQREKTREVLIDWLTYTPGEGERYFARYGEHGGLIGLRHSYGSEAFNDHHFHFGYYTMAGAMMAMMDPSFAEDYGPMLTLVAKDYANWDRGDERFPWMRNLDPWAGHSWASGVSSPGGNNQESSSEAMMSWAGLHLLGLMLNDDEMAAAGAMGYAMESRAVLEYWFDWRQTNWSPDYPFPVVGILWSAGQQYATYFSGDPGWIHGIQWFPAGPWLDYLAEDDALTERQLAALRRDRAKKEGSGELKEMGPVVGNVLLGYLSVVRPEEAVAAIESLAANDDPITRDHEDHGLHLFDAHARAALGTLDRRALPSDPLTHRFVDENGDRIDIRLVPAASAGEAPRWVVERRPGR